MGTPIELLMTRDVLAIDPSMTVKQMDRALLTPRSSSARMVSTIASLRAAIWWAKEKAQ